MKQSYMRKFKYKFQGGVLKNTGVNLMKIEELQHLVMEDDGDDDSFSGDGDDDDESFDDEEEE